MRAFLLGLTSGIGVLLPSFGADTDFSHQVVPVLRQHCFECHGGDKAEGGFSINTRESFLDDDTATPGNADTSLFLQLITDPDPDYQMPPSDKDRVPPDAVAILRNWVADGMPWEAGFTFAPPRYEPPLKPHRPQLPPAKNGRDHPVDRLLDDWLVERNLPLPEPAEDSVFLRRAHLDLVGLLPDPEVTQTFLNDSAPDKRNQLVRTLLQDDIGYAEHWLSFWNDLLRNDYTGTGFITGGRRQISGWLYESLIKNKPFDSFTRELIAPPSDASRGFIDGIKWRGEVSAGQTLPIQFAQSVSQSFLGINLKCASCHDSFIDRWSLEEAYGLAAVYAGEPLEVHRCDKKTGEVAQASWLFPELGQIDPGVDSQTRLSQLAALMTHPENGRFSRTIVNRLWAQLMGRGLVHPLDAMQSEPWHSDLLDYLASHFQDHGYDLKKTLELIATSQAYQSRSANSGAEPKGNSYVYDGPLPKRLTAEQFVDAMWHLTGAAPSQFDAPIARGIAATDPSLHPPVTAQWIWGPSAADGKVPAGGEQMVFTRTFSVDRPLQAAGLIVTCDNEYTIFINNQELVRDNDWTTLEARPATSLIRSKGNRILAIARNAGTGHNAAGFFLALRLEFEDGTEEIIATDSRWQVSEKVPSNPKPARWTLDKLPWTPVAVIPALSVWSEKIDPIAPSLLAQASVFTPRMVRASLVKSDFLMRSLGRPNRDQIVSSRPDNLTTLEAIDLYNNKTLSDALAQGGERLASRNWPTIDNLIDSVYLSTLMRLPSQEERFTIRDALGSEPTPTDLQDFLWALCMNPEFFLIR